MIMISKLWQCLWSLLWFKVVVLSNVFHLTIYIRWSNWRDIWSCCTIWWRGGRGNFKENLSYVKVILQGFMGHGKPGKSWNLIVSHGKSCKIDGYLVNFVIFPAVHKIHVSSCKKKNYRKHIFCKNLLQCKNFLT